MDATFDSADAAAIEVQSDSEGWLTNMPWWFVSAGVHLILLLVATLVTIERYMAVEGGITTVRVTPLRAAAAPLELIRDVPFTTQLPGITDQPQPTEQARDPEIFFPIAEVGDRNISDEGIDGDTMRGQSELARGFQWGDKGGFKGRSNQAGEGVYDTLGVGGGGGMPWRYGNGPGGNKTMRADGSVGKPPPDTENAVTAALKWLARHQNPDGSWGAQNHLNHCVGAKCAGIGDADFDTGLTSLALLAYLGAGYTHLSKDEHDDAMNPGRKLRFGDVVKSGLKWLMSKQDPNGCIGGGGPKYMYNHAIAALALSEAYGMSGTQNFRGPAQQSIDFLIAAQNPDRAWRYAQQCGDNDSSVTGWAIMALKSAELSELNVPAREAYEKTRKWFDEVTDPTVYYRAGYNGKTSGKVFVPGKNETYLHHESMTAVGVLCRIFMMKNRKDPALGGVALLVSDLPTNKANLTDYYYWYYGSLALFQYDGPHGPYWKKWESAMRDALVPHQKTGKDGCANGSWTSDDERWGFEGGRVYATAINALTLEVYYRYPNVFRGDK